MSTVFCEGRKQNHKLPLILAAFCTDDSLTIIVFTSVALISLTILAIIVTLCCISIMLCCVIARMKKRHRTALEEEPYYSCIHSAVEVLNIGGNEVSIIRNQAYGTSCLAQVAAPLDANEHVHSGDHDYDSLREFADFTVQGCLENDEAHRDISEPTRGLTFSGDQDTTIDQCMVAAIQGDKGCSSTGDKDIAQDDVIDQCMADTSQGECVHMWFSCILSSLYKRVYNT